MIRLALPYALGAALLGCFALSGGLYWQTQKLNAATARISGLVLALDATRARLSNIQKDRDSDATIDNMPDLTIVPPGWLLPPKPGSGGLY